MFAEKVASSHQKHIVELQSMRGIAAFVVLLNHCLSFFAKSDADQRIMLLANGHAAVIFFFVLSGFVLGASLHRRELDRPAIAKFFAKRFFRIYPAVWIASLASLAYVAIVHYAVAVPHASTWFKSGFYPQANYGLMHIIAAFAALATFLIPPLWTITIELIASVFMPFFVWAAQKGAFATSMLMGALLLLSFVWAAFSKVSAPIYLVDFMIGTSLAVYKQFWRAQIGRLGAATPAICAFAAAYLISNRAIFAPLNYDNPVSQLVEAAMAAILVAAIGLRVVDLAGLRSRWLIRLGDGSFSLYLVHFTVMCVCGTVLDFILTGFGVPYNGVLWSALLAIVVALISIPLANLLYETVEVGGIRLGDRVIARMTSDSFRPKTYLRS